MRKPVGRPKDKTWEQDVTKEKNGKWKCKYCGHEFSGKISVTRIRAHIDKTGKGAAPCSFVRNINGGDHNNMASDSSNPQEHGNTLGPIQVDDEGVPERIDASAINNSSNNRDNNIDYGVAEGVPERIGASGITSSSNDRDNNIDFGGMGSYIVGTNFERNIKEMWKLLSDDQVFIIGVHGMGGVGKTLLATHLENEIKRKGSFKDVFWVTVSHNASTSKLQHDVARRMGVKLDENDDEKIRAEILSSALQTKEKPVLILDDVWKYIDLEKVGIRRSSNLNGIKVIVTTRLKDVCQQLDCLPNNMIQMLPLWRDEGEELFKVKLGHSGTPATLPPEVEQIAARIVKRCGGLPLGISVMARTLKGSINNIHRWKYALNKLEKLEMEQELEEEVLKVLKRSYDNLVEEALQNCFLYCALFSGFTRHELILKLLDIGLFKGRSLEEIFCEGNNILDKLIAHSLLQEEEDENGHLHFSVSPFVRVMACNILKESQRCVVKFLERKTYFQKELTVREWKDLELGNMAICSYEKIPEDTSPNCPHLSTLIIRPHDTNDRNGINYFPECFFKNMNALTILDLSRNDNLESLPNSLSDLRSLVSLTLRECSSLKYVPPLEKLIALSRLDISHCSIEQVQGLEKLIKLKWLDLSYNRKLIMELGFVDVLPNLTSMQHLDLRYCPHVKIKVEDVQGMNMLECLKGTFLDCKHYNRYMDLLLDQNFGPKTYNLFIQNFDSWAEYFVYLEDSWILSNHVRHLSLCYNDQLICLCGALTSRLLLP